MRFCTRFLLMLGGAALLASAVNTQQVVLFGNLNLTPDTYYSINTQGPLFQSFSTGPANVVLSDVQLYLALGALSSGSFQVTLFSDANSQPGSQLGTLGTLNDSIVTAPGIYDVAVSPGIPLSPNTRYWIGLFMQGGATNTTWGVTFSANGTGNIQNQFFCYFTQLAKSNARRPQPHGLALPPCYSNAVDPFLMQVSATAPTVPSAPDLTLTGMALLTLLLGASAVLILRRVRPSEG